MNGATDEHGVACWEMWTKLRRKRPLVHCITNFVSMDLLANSLLALGASPIMAHAEEEMEELSQVSEALVVNIGTLSKHVTSAMKSAASSSKCWVLDPVGCGLTSYRTETCLQLLALSPTVVRGNPDEIIALANASKVSYIGASKSVSPLGVESTTGSESAVLPAVALALHANTVVAVTGEMDIITDGHTILTVHNGHELMQKVCATGCTLSGIVAAFLTVAPSKDSKDVAMTTAYAMAVYALIGERAIHKLEAEEEYDPLSLTRRINQIGPGSLRIKMIDMLYSMKEETIINKFSGVKISSKVVQ